MKACTCDLFDGDPHYMAQAFVFASEYIMHGPESQVGRRAIERSDGAALEIIAGAYEERYEKDFDTDDKKVWRSPWVPMHALGIAGMSRMIVCVLDGTRDWTTLEIAERMAKRYYSAPEGRYDCVQALAQQLQAQAESTRA